MTTITREDLEYAAKAAGYTVVGDANKMVAQPGIHAGGLVIRNSRGGDSLWHPGKDDGDCARMWAAVGIDTEWNAECVDLSIDGRSINRAWFQDHANDKCAAWRYASVKLAAAVGRAMP